MKAIWFVFIFMLCGNCFAQEVNKISVDTVRVKGYFVIDTNKSDSMSDIPFVYFFVKVEDMENGFKSAYSKYSDLENSGEIFFTDPYISDTLNLHDITLKNRLGLEIDFKKPEIRPREFFNRNKLVYSLKETPKDFKLCYIDGLYLRVSVPKRFRLLFGTPYQLRYMNPNLDYYNHYFLIDTKFIGYNIHCNDPDLILQKG